MYNLSDDDLRRITELNHAKLWVNVDDLLPDHETVALVVDSDGGMWVAMYVAFAPQSAFWSPQYDPSDVARHFEYPITHWMPLPDPPQPITIPSDK